ncbi:MAG: DUF3822 family protein [Bacteroidales bacterium]
MSAPFSKTISIGSEAFSPGTENKKSLSIELLPDGFSFSVLDHQQFKYLILESFRARQVVTMAEWSGMLHQMVRDNPLLAASYHQVSISWFTTQLTLIPVSLYQQEQKDSYYQFANNLPPDHMVAQDRLNTLEAYGLYAISTEVNNQLNQLFPGHRLRHSGTVLIESLLATRQLNEWKASMVLHIRRKHFDVVLFEDQKLNYYNSFRYEEFGDLMYYLFFVLEQFGLDANAMDVLLVGEISLDNDRFLALSQYFRKVSFIGRSDIYRYAQEFDALPHHYFYTLLNLNSCG